MSATIIQDKKEAPLSRLGRKPVDIPAGVKVNVANNGAIAVEGPKGKLNWILPRGITAAVAGSHVNLAVTENNDRNKALHGMSRKLVLNMVEGVTKGFQKKIVIEGVGYRAQINGNVLNMTLGFSHPVNFPIPQGIVVKQFDPKAPHILLVEGVDKQKVGQVAAQIRAIKPPEPYKGTGIRYDNEIIKRKAGKAAVGAAGGGSVGGAKK